MHIGIDLDNTVLDATSSHLHYYNLASGKSFTADDVNDFYLYRLYGWNEEEREQVYTRYGYDIHWNSLPYPQAIETLQLLYERYSISILTARPAYFQEVTVEWLKLHHINYHQIVFTEDKLQECQQRNIDVLIDDGPHYAQQFAQLNRPVILYKQPYNRDIRSETVYEADSWGEVMKRLESLEKLLQPKG